MLEALQLFRNLVAVDSPRFVAVYSGSIVRGVVQHAVDASQRGWRATIDGVARQPSFVSPTVRHAVASACQLAFPRMEPPTAEIMLRASLTEADLPTMIDADRGYPRETADVDGYASVGPVERRTSGEEIHRSRDVVTVVDPAAFDAETVQWFRDHAPRWTTICVAQMAIIERFDLTDETHLAYSSWFRGVETAPTVATFAVAPHVRGQRVAVYPPIRTSAGRYDALDGFVRPGAIVGALTWDGANGDGADDDGA